RQQSFTSETKSLRASSDVSRTAPMATPSCSAWAGYLSAVERATVPFGVAKAKTAKQARPAANHLLFVMALTPSFQPDSLDQVWPQFSATHRSARKCAGDRQRRLC